MTARMNWRRAKLHSKQSLDHRWEFGEDGFFIKDKNQRRKAVLAARKLARFKSTKADATKAKERKRYAAEMEAFEQRDRFTLIKRNLRHHWPDE